MSDIRTARLILHPTTAAEAHRILSFSPARADRWASDYPFEGDIDAVVACLNAQRSRAWASRWGYYQIRQLSNRTAIGGIGFVSPPATGGSVDIGYGLAPSARGNGYAAEALIRMLELARTNGAVRVTGETTVDNHASRKTMVASGMQATGHDSHLLHYAWPSAD